MLLAGSAPHVLDAVSPEDLHRSVRVNWALIRLGLVLADGLITSIAGCELWHKSREPDCGKSSRCVSDCLQADRRSQALEPNVLPSRGSCIMACGHPFFPTLSTCLGVPRSVGKEVGWDQ